MNYSNNHSSVSSELEKSPIVSKVSSYAGVKGVLSGCKFIFLEPQNKWIRPGVDLGTEFREVLIYDSLK